METATEQRNRIRESFLRVFCSDHGVVVLRELAAFARADEAEYCADPRKDAYWQGRRSVVLEIRNIMKEQKNHE